MKRQLLEEMNGLIFGHNDDNDATTNKICTGVGGGTIHSSAMRGVGGGT